MEIFAVIEINLVVGPEHLLFYLSILYRTTSHAYIIWGKGFSRFWCEEDCQHHLSSISPAIFHTSHSVYSVYACVDCRSIKTGVNGNCSFNYHILLLKPWWNALDLEWTASTVSFQYESAARTLVDIGGVEFLSQLRQYCDPSLHSLIDDTLEHLLRILSNSAGMQSLQMCPPTVITL